MYIRALWNSSMEGNSDIGTHRYFEQADFFMPELILKELWTLEGKNA